MPDSPIVTFDVAPDGQEIGERLDKVITAHLATLSRVRVQQLIREGYVTINGAPGKPSHRLEGHATITIRLAAHIVTPDAAASTEPEPLPLDVIYEDGDLAAINKPAGMVVHPAAGHARGTLVNALLARWPQVARVGGKERAGIVHRLDKDTSGVLLIAKTESARLNLMAQFAARQVQKRYLTLVEGTPATPTGCCTPTTATACSKCSRRPGAPIRFASTWHSSVTRSPAIRSTDATNSDWAWIVTSCTRSR
jgi:23S rRNA pseudouridine1911/1915/1917 synthase